MFSDVPSPTPMPAADSPSGPATTPMADSPSPEISQGL